MKSRLVYVEKSTGANHNGPAWIGRARFSRTGGTVYFNNMCFLGGRIDIETGDLYWISGIKKNGQDRHRFGKGKIFIDRAVIEEYLAFRKMERLDSQKYEIVDIFETKTPADFYELHNVSDANGFPPYK